MDRLKLFCLLLSVSLLLLAGCGSEGPPESILVSGSVTFDGSPVPSGEIIFRDAAGQVRSCGGSITGGQYSFEASPGSKTVEITAMREVPGKIDESNPGESVPLMEMYIPAKYNTETTLTTEVTESGANPSDFALTP